jgi:hypothetical protein
MEQRIKVITGDILICKANIIPVIQHFGVVVVEPYTICVYHCSPGSNVTCDTLDDFLKFHELIRLRRTNADKARLYEKYKEVKHRKYDLNDFNCVQFANYLTTE